MDKQRLLNAIISTQKLIIGQHAGGAQWMSGIDTYINSLSDQPGLIGLDLAYGEWGVYTEGFGGFSEEWGNKAIELWESGSALMVNWHIRNPWTQGDVQDTRVGAFSDLWTSGNDAHSYFRTMLDRARFVLQWFADRDIPLLLRPLHECNGANDDGTPWHWYENRAKDDYIQLWRYVHSVLDPVGNLIWVYSPNRYWDGLHPPSYYYPGDDVVDIAALDHYARVSQWDWVDDSWADLLSIGKPVALGEFGYGSYDRGRSTDLSSFISHVEAHCPGARFVQFWNGSYAISNMQNPTSMLNAGVCAGEWWTDDPAPDPQPEPDPEPIDLSEQIAALWQAVTDLSDQATEMQRLEHPMQATAIRAIAARIAAQIDALESV